MKDLLWKRKNFYKKLPVKKIINTVEVDSLAQEILEVAGYIENMPDKTDVMFKASVDINNISEQSAQETQSVAAAIEEQSASVKEIAAASHNLSQLACDLQEKVQNFKI